MTDADVARQDASSASFSSGYHANPDAFIRQLCFDSFHARHPAAACDDDVISAGTGRTGAEPGRRRRDVAQLQRLPLADRQLRNCCVHSNHETRDPRDVTAD